jgi:Flp pilus assembly protein TadG
MMYRRTSRPGTHAVEAALIFPVFFLLVIGLIVFALGVFRYQELASLAREGARYASVRGATYELYTGNTAATPADVYNNAILPSAIMLDPDQLGYSVTWNPDNQQGSMVTVTVTYHWVPEAFFGGIDMSSTSSMAVSY